MGFQTINLLKSTLISAIKKLLSS